MRWQHVPNLGCRDAETARTITRGPSTWYNHVIVVSRAKPRTKGNGDDRWTDVAEEHWWSAMDTVICHQRNFDTKSYRHLYGSMWLGKNVILYVGIPVYACVLVVWLAQDYADEDKDVEDRGTYAKYHCDHNKPEKPPECRHASFLLFKFKYSASKRLSPYGEIAYNYAEMCLDEQSIRRGKHVAL